MNARILPLVAMTLVGLGCSGSHDQPAPATPVKVVQQLSSVEAQVGTGSNPFGFTLLAQLDRGQQGQNVVFSPLSVTMALGMALNGANGATLSAMTDTMDLTGTSLASFNAGCQGLLTTLPGLDPAVTILDANSLWVQVGFPILPAYANTLQTDFAAPATSLDLTSPSAATTLSNWIATQTQGNITNMVSPTDLQQVQVALINALYFKGTWTTAFDPSQTQAEPFNLAGGTTQTCSMMNLTSPLPYCADATAQVADLPYGDGQYAMTVVLPTAGTDLDGLVAGLTASQWNGWVQNLVATDLQLQLPRFSLQSCSNLDPALGALGMSVAFTTAADFSNLSSSPLMLDKVLHAAMVEVDEQGTTAAASTVVLAGASAVLTVPMTVNRPFLFAIRETTSGTILFLGKVATPAGS